MELLELMKNRRSIRKYTDAKIEGEKINLILSAGILAPSSKNIRPVEFVVVENKNTLEQLSKNKSGGAGMLKDAACAVVVIADTREADAWTEDCSLAMGNMMLMAESLGLGACWIQERLRNSSNGMPAAICVRDILDIPDYFEVEAILSLGYPEKKDAPRNWDETEISKIHREKF